MPDPRKKHQYPLFTKALLAWFKANARALPWRKTKDPYRIWVSEIMLQQTTVSTVILYYERWIKRYPSVEKLALSDEQEVLKMWQGLGYYNRARNFHKAARIVVDKHNSCVPENPEELNALPGIGPYATAAISSIAFKKILPVVDANVRRVMMRVLLIKDKISTKHDEIITKTLNDLISTKEPGDFNEAMMEIGALICKPKEPSCNQCPVAKYCKAYQEGVQELIPEPVSKIIEEIQAVVGIIKVNKKLFIQQRPQKGLLAGLWEFPGGKVEKSDKNHTKALEREIFEETGLQVTVGKRIGQVTHFYTRFKVHLTAFVCEPVGKVTLKENMRLVTTEELKKYPMPSGSAKIIERYLKT